MQNKGHVIVTGTFGAWFNCVSKHLQENGWAVTWPGQDIDIFNGRHFLNANAQNIEVLNLIYNFCELNNTDVWSKHLPEFYENTYPGPAEFLAKFESPAVICSIHLNSFLDIWAEHVDVVIDIQANESEDMASLQSWSSNIDSNYLKDLRKHHLERYTKHLKLFKRVFTMTNAEVKEKQFAKLSEFLASVF